MNRRFHHPTEKGPQNDRDEPTLIKQSLATAATGHRKEVRPSKQQQQQQQQLKRAPAD